jgi:hypothetical protein
VSDHGGDEADIERAIQELRGGIGGEVGVARGGKDRGEDERRQNGVVRVVGKGVGVNGDRGVVVAGEDVMGR